MKFLPIFVALLSATSVNSQSFDECGLQNEGLPIQQIFKKDIQDDAPIGIILELTTGNVESATLEPENFGKYFEVFLDLAENTLIISLSNAYGTIEDNEQSQPVTVLRIEIQLICQGKDNLFYVDFTVIDNNNHVPTFPGTGAIAYQIPLPFPSKIPLHLLSDTPDDNKLTARDIDISNDIITFEVDPADIFQITGVLDVRDPLKKTFVATLTAISPLTKLDTNTFTVTAKDKDGEASLPMDISITVDEESSLPTPLHFKEKFYQGQYTITGGVHSLKIDDLLLDNAVAIHEINVELDQGDINGDFFENSYDSGTQTIAITKNEDLTEEILEANDYLTLWVQANYKDFDIPATTVSVLIELPSNQQSVESAFDETLYIGSYDKDTNQVDLPIAVLIIDLDIEIKPSVNSEHFEVQVSATNPLIYEIILPNGPLPDSVIAEYENVPLVLEAKIGDVVHGHAAIIIDLPEPESVNVFSDITYKANYVTDQSPHTIELETKIVVTSTETLSVVIEQNGFPDYFDVIDDNLDEITIDLKLELTPEILNDNEIISLFLYAKNSDNKIYGSTVVIIDLPDGECPVNPPIDNVFSDTTYKAIYKADQNPHTIQLETNIVVTSTETLTVVIEENGFPDYFDVIDDNLDEITIDLKLELTPEILNDNEIISLFLYAKNSDNKIYGSTVVIINLPDGQCPALEYAFGQSLYEGNYDAPEGGVPSVTFTQVITADATEELRLDFIPNDVDENFEVTFSNPPTSPNVEITVKTPLPPIIIDENDFITLVLVASGVNTGNDFGETAFVIALPPKASQVVENVFEQTLFTGLYSISEQGVHSVAFTDPITANSNNALQIDFILPNEFAQYFGIDTSALPDVGITVNDPGLPEDLIEENDFITLILAAKSTDGTKDYGETGLVIELPEKVCPIEPSDEIFGGAVFEGEYVVPNDGPHTVTTDAITVIPDDVVATIVGDYSDNFDVEVNADKQVILSIIQELTEDVWNKDRYISILLQGTSGALAGAARIILGLPEPECEDPNPGDPTIIFEDAYFIVDDPTAMEVIGTLLAHFDPDEPHTFSISNQPNWVELVGAELKVVANTPTLPPGTFKFKATVTGDESNRIKSALVTIYVLSNLPGEVKTGYSMIVKAIDEEVAVTDIYLLQDVTVNSIVYEYIITNQDPETVPRLFRIEGTGEERFLKSEAIDREDRIFASMGVAQVVLTLSIQEKPTTTSINSILAAHPLFKYLPKHQSREEGEFQQCLNLPKEIPRIDSIMHIPIIITDKNDSPPKFATPSIVVGYPTKDIAYDINPPYLVKVEATDDDEPQNAIIEYSSTSTSVKVNSVTGIVYPTEGLYNAAQTETVIIRASDTVAEAELEIKILLLDKDHVSVVVLPNVILEELEARLAALSTLIGVSAIRSLSAGTLPLSEAAASVRVDSDLHLKAIVYAIQNGAAIDHNELKELLVGQQGISIIEYTPGVTIPGTGDGDEECDDTGLIAGISVLAVALVACIVGFIVFYLKKKKSNASLDLEQLPEHKTSFKKSNASQSGYSNDIVLKDVGTRRPTQYPMEGPKLELDDSSSNSSASDNTNENEESFDEARERRKSVTFNEQMQHFDITNKDTEKDTDSIAADDTEDKET